MKNYTDRILQIYGPFWFYLWKEENLIKALSEGKARIFDQVNISGSDIKNYISREKIPVKFPTRWKFRRVTEDEISLEQVKIGEFSIGDDTLLGQDKDNPFKYYLSTDDDSCLFITDSPVTHKIVWQRGAEFDYVDGNIVFLKNPFNSGFKETIVVDSDGNPQRAINLWFNKVEEDINSIKDFYGSYFNINTPSSDFYKKIVNYAWDLSVQGATKKNINALLASTVDNDVAMEAGIVSVIWEENNRNYILINDLIHSAPKTSNVIVDVNQTVEKGELLFDGVKIFKASESIDSLDFPAIVLDAGIIGGKYKSSLLFENRECEITLITYSIGNTIQLVDDNLQLVESINGEEFTLIKEGIGVGRIPDFPIGGHPSTVKQYKEDLLSRAIASGTDLWQIIVQDQSSPYFFNPAKFILDNLLKNNTFLIKFNEVPPFNVPYKSVIKQLINTVPAGTTFLLYQEIEGTLDEIGPSMSDEEGMIFHSGYGEESMTLQAGTQIVTNKVF